MAWVALGSEEFNALFKSLDHGDQEAVTAAVEVLEDHTPKRKSPRSFVAARDFRQK